MTSSKLPDAGTIGRVALVVRLVSLPIIVGAAPVNHAMSAETLIETKVTHGLSEPAEFLGSSVAIFGNVLVVGADAGDISGACCDSGFVYVYEPDGQGGFNETMLQASDGVAFDRFGKHVAISGNTIVVGVPDRDNVGLDVGAAYVYTRQSPGVFVETKLTTSDGAPGDRFGASVAVVGNTIIVGAPGDDDKGVVSGSIYLFSPNGVGGYTESKMTAPDGAATNNFGESAAAFGQRFVIGAPGDDSNGQNSGSVYAFEPFAGDYLITKHTASDAEAGDIFGLKVAMSFTGFVVAAESDDDNGDRAGSVYVYRGTGFGGYLETKLLASDGVALDFFGSSVGLDGDTVVVGARQKHVVGQSGGAYIFRRNLAGVYSESSLNASDASTGDFFGNAVAVSDFGILIGALGVKEFFGGVQAPGAFYLYQPDREAPSWGELANITASTDAGLSTARVNFNVTASDNVDVTESSCGPSSGSVFSLGSTTVTCSASDAAGNEGTATFVVMVRDLEVPSWTVPANISVLTTTLSGMPVNYAANATDNVGVNHSSCSPPSGDTFQLGSTTVNCTASDTAGNVGDDAFNVTVTVNQSSLQVLIAGIEALPIAGGVKKSLQAPLQQVTKILSDGKPGNDRSACSKLNDFLATVNARSGDGSLTTQQAAQLTLFGTTLRNTFGC